MSEPTPEATSETTPDSVKQQVIDMIKTCYDPEIPVNIYELGLIYDVNVNEDRHVTVKMTLTSPMCPVAESLPIEVRDKVSRIPEVAHADVDLTWEPPWDPSMMSEAAKLDLGF